MSYSLFSAWLLSFLFEGQVLRSLIEGTNIDGAVIITMVEFVVFIGLFTGGFFVKEPVAAKKKMIISAIVCIAASLVFYFPSSAAWYAAIMIAAYFSSFFIVSWGFQFKMLFNSEERFRTAADVLIYSNILMIFINVLTVATSALIGLTASIMAFAAAVIMLLGLEVYPKDNAAQLSSKMDTALLSSGLSAVSKPFIFLYMFIFIITIDSGLMYQVVNPVFSQYIVLSAYYWAVPYILALLILRNLPTGINKAYILYISVIMIGLSYILFLLLDKSIAAYLIINALMLGGFGVCDLFWWSILGSYLDYHDNPARIFGIGLSINILGILIGGIIGKGMMAAENNYVETSVIALLVVFSALIILPILNLELTRNLKNNEFLMSFNNVEAVEGNKEVIDFQIENNLTEKETEVVKLLLRGYTYKVIAESLYISENTIKYHIKNIYQKLGINNKMELIKMFSNNESYKQ